MKKTLLFLMIITVLTACSRQIKNNFDIDLSDTEEINLVAPDGRQKLLTAEVADEPNEHVRGLMNRRELPAGNGMLFKYDEPMVLNFWMKNTTIPLDIIFFDELGYFVSSAGMVPCQADPCVRYSSQEKAQYALEVNAGFIAENEIGEGWVLVFKK